MNPETLLNSSEWRVEAAVIKQKMCVKLQQPSAVCSVTNSGGCAAGNVNMDPSSSELLPWTRCFLLSVRPAMAPEQPEGVESRAPLTSLPNNALLKGRMGWRRKPSTIPFYQRHQGDSRCPG
ncbi:hypothetical protein NQZ68_040384 [Dissostichus eleginoides]|nr:hypothetical protein NQZ68_040384 [Dissostichus eleginoides]